MRTVYRSHSVYRLTGWPIPAQFTRQPRTFSVSGSYGFQGLQCKLLHILEQAGVFASRFVV